MTAKKKITKKNPLNTGPRTRNLAVEAMSICMQTGWYGGRNIPVGLEAVPGCGKTQITEQVAEKLGAVAIERGLCENFAFSLFVGPQTMPESIEGIPAPDMDAKALSRLPLIGVRKLIDAGYGVCAFDELTSTLQATGAAMMTAIQDGRYGDVVMPHTVARVCMWNPPTCAAAGRDFSAPEINRICRIEWQLPLGDFLDHLAGGEGAVAHIRVLDEDWEEKGTPRAATLVRAYLQTNQAAANTMQSGKTTEAQASMPWASQRSWANVVRLLAAVISLGEEPNSDLAYILVKGMIGEGEADSFIGFLREMDLPDPEDILAEALKDVKGETDEERIKRIGAAIPKAVWDRPDKMRICLDSVAIAAQQTDHPEWTERWNAAWRALEPVLDSKPDHALSATRILIRNKPPEASAPDAAMKAWYARQEAGLGMRRGGVKRRK